MTHDGHRRFLFRTYLLLVAALLTVAIVLQFGFERLQTQDTDRHDPLLDATLALIDSRLAAAESPDRPAIAAVLAEETGIPVTLLPPETVGGDAAEPLETLLDDDGNRVYLYRSSSIPEMIYLGPVAETQENWSTRLLPPIFYLSIVVLVGVWLRPLLSDLDTITDAAQRFAADYRTPLETSTQTTQLTGLAQDLDDMSGRLSGLIQTQKELIAALSHEMRTPLARIRFALAILEKNVERYLDEKQLAEIAELTSDVQEIDDLIGTMLNYARLDHPDLEMRCQDVPVDAWLKATTEKFGKDSKTLTVLADNAPDTVRMDPRLMTLALSNLLSNGERHAANDVSCTLTTSEEHYELSVEDDGPGVPEEERAKVFKAFTRLDDSRDRATGGYGLGLAIVARIAALHGGSAKVSASGTLGGAAFSVRWPVVDGAATGGTDAF